MSAISNIVVIDNFGSFRNTEIESISAETAVSIIGDELYVDTFTPVIYYTVHISQIFKPTDYDGIETADGKILVTHSNSDLRTIPYGTKVTWICNGSIQGQFSIKNVERLGKGKYQLNCMSAVGLMDTQVHVGGIYNGMTFSDALANIIGASGGEYTYSVDSDVASTRVYGWLPYSTRRNNLYQLMFAYGVCLVKDNSGNMKFSFLRNTTSTNIPQNRVFSGGSVIYDEPASEVQVTEHGYYYLNTVLEKTLFDNIGKDAVSNYLVTFEEPVEVMTIHASDGSSLTINERGVNYAIISGTGKLIGQPYVHTTSVVKHTNSNSTKENVVRVEDATLVTATNAENVTERLSQYYFNATTVKEDIMVDVEKCGNRYNVDNPFYEDVTGFLTKMSSNVTAVHRASCEFIQNYEPVAIGSTYTQEAIIPLATGASSTWNIPSGTKLIRVVLIGYGEDGESGENGEDGETPDTYWGGKGGAGGKGGSGGLGGRILSLTVDCTGLSSIAFSNSGKNSRATIRGVTYSSADGAVSPNGYFDEIGNTTYATPGANGIDGGNGGKGGNWSYLSWAAEEHDPEDGEDVSYFVFDYYGGTGGLPNVFAGGDVGISESISVFGGAGGGGGAANGENGADGRDALETPIPPGLRGLNDGGDGGDGNPADDANPDFGCGGNGGHGGGGGGGAGQMVFYNYDNYFVAGNGMPNPGKGGTGGAGSSGSPGCAIIYY